jgi:retron-type reverse transcriptase
LIAGRISDRHILGWIKQWLRAPVVEEDQEGKRRSKPTERGTPQGGVMTPPTQSQTLSLNGWYPTREVEITLDEMT